MLFVPPVVDLFPPAQELRAEDDFTRAESFFGEEIVSPFVDLSLPDNGLKLMLNGRSIPIGSEIKCVVQSTNLTINGVPLVQEPGAEPQPATFKAQPAGADSLRFVVYRVQEPQTPEHEAAFDFVLRNLESALSKGGTVLVGLTSKRQLYCALIPPESDPDYAESKRLIDGVLKIFK